MPTFLRAAVVALCLFALAACAPSEGGSDASESSDVSITGSGDPSVAATVSGTEISVDEVAQRFDQFKTQPQVAEQLANDPDGNAEAGIQATILSQLIQSELLEQWAADLDIEITDTDVAAERATIIERVGQEAFDTQVEQSGLSDEQIDNELRLLAMQNAISVKVGEDTEVSDADVEAFYEENRATQYGEKATARHILVEDKAKAGKIMAQLRKGADFVELAKTESTDPGGAQGGELPEFGRGQMIPEFEEAVFASKPGQLVGPVKTEFGYHIIEVLDIKAGRELADVEDEIRGQLAQSQGGNALTAELQKRAKEAQVTVNPRFGTWNPDTGQVEPTEPLGSASETASEGAVPLGSEGPTESMVVPTESATP